MSDSQDDRDFEACVEDNIQCRDIVREIMRFGVSQKQIYFIMYLLSLELENVEHMKELSAIFREVREDTHIIEHPADVYKIDANGGTGSVT